VARGGGDGRAALRRYRAALRHTGDDRTGRGGMAAVCATVAVAGGCHGAPARAHLVSVCPKSPLGAVCISVDKPLSLWDKHCSRSERGVGVRAANMNNCVATNPNRPLSKPRFCRKPMPML